jgi:hypothetical protein
MVQFIHHRQHNVLHKKHQSWLLFDKIAVYCENNKGYFGKVCAEVIIDCCTGRYIEQPLDFKRVNRVCAYVSCPTPSESHRCSRTGCWKETLNWLSVERTWKWGELHDEKIHTCCSSTRGILSARLHRKAWISCKV